MANGIDGKLVANVAKQTFGRTNISKEELHYIITMLNPSSYILKHHKVKGHPITFHISNHDSTKAHSHRPWQVDIINDKHSDKVVIKSRQLGLSEIGVAEMIWFADTHSYAEVKCLYTFPTNRQMEEFVKMRLNPVLSKDYYATILDHKEDSLKSKRIRNSFLSFRSASQASAVEGFDGDYLSIDEYDRISASAMMSAVESMSSSSFSMFRRWSTPTIPNYGIHEVFDASDKRVYMHKCDSCGHRQQLDYERNIECIDESGIDVLAKTVKEGTFRFVCQKCGKTLDRWYNGEWVAEFPSRTADGGGTRGYLISQMNAVWISADDLKRKELKANSKQHFFNYVLGYPYEDLSLAVKEGDIDTHRRQDFDKPMFNRGNYRFISVGIDWGY